MKKGLFVLIVFFLGFWKLSAQCSMCKAVAETSGEGDGLNTGILYLMVIPYLLFFGIGFYILKQRKKKTLRPE